MKWGQLCNSTHFLGRAPRFALACALLACETKREDTTVAPATETSAKTCGESTITGAGIGDLRIGMSVSAVRARCLVIRDTTRLATEGQLARMIAVAFPSDTLEAEIVNGRVWRIEVLSTRFRTSDSIGVGTPLRDLLALRAPRGLTGEGQLFVASPEHCGLSFRLSDNGSSARTQDWDRIALSRLPPATVVDKILIVGCDRR